MPAREYPLRIVATCCPEKLSIGNRIATAASSWNSSSSSTLALAKALTMLDTAWASYRNLSSPFPARLSNCDTELNTSLSVTPTLAKALTIKATDCAVEAGGRVKRCARKVVVFDMPWKTTASTSSTSHGDITFSCTHTHSRVCERRRSD